MAGGEILVLMVSVRLRDWIPKGTCVLLTADLFYSTTGLVLWCREAGWGYRIRLKGDLTLSYEGGQLTTGEIGQFMPEGIVNAELCGSGVTTNIGFLQEKSHKDPWIIAMYWAVLCGAVDEQETVKKGKKRNPKTEKVPLFLVQTRLEIPPKVIPEDASPVMLKSKNSGRSG